MKQKLKIFYECMRPNVALMMVTILVVSLLSVGAIEEVKAMDFGGRTAWADAEGVSGKSFELKSVTTQDCYTEYVLQDGEYVPNTVSIDPAAKPGSRENPYAIESEEDLILFGQILLNEPSPNSTNGKYYILTKDVYDMKGDSYYMLPLFPCFYDLYTISCSTNFQGILIGNQAVIQNAYIIDKDNSNYNACCAGLFSGLCNAAIWDLRMNHTTFSSENEHAIGGLAGVTEEKCTLINCNFSYSVVSYNVDVLYFNGLVGVGNPNLYNCKVTIQDIVQPSYYTIQTLCNSYNNQIYNCSSTIIKDGFGFTTMENTPFDLSREENVYGTLTIPSSGSVYRDENKISSPGNQIILYKNGTFRFFDDSKEVKINDKSCDATATYNTVKLDYKDGTTETIIYPTGETYTLPIPEKDESEFFGWTGGDITEPTKDVEILEDFEGSQLYTANWKVDLESCDIELKDNSVYSYTGKAIEPVVVVKKWNEVLKEGKDYQVSYINNVDIATLDSNNAPTVVVTGIGNCTGSKSLTFTIEKATPLIQTAPTASKIHVGTALASSDLIGGMAVSDNSISMKGTFSWKDGSIVPTLADSGVTKYTVVFTPEDSNHYTTAEVDITVLVDPKPLAGIDVSLNNGSVYIYTGKEIKPVVLVKFENTLLEEGKDYQVSYENNINVATMATENAPTVVVEGIGDYSGSKSLKFTIEKATPLIQTVPTASKIQEGDALSSSTLSGGVALNGIPMNGNDVSGNHLNFVDGTFRWKDGTIIPTVADSGVTKYAVVFTPDDTDNYNTFEFGITVIVEKKSSTEQPSSGNTGTQKPGSGDSGSGNSDTQNPGSGDSSTDKPATQPQIGEKVSDSKNNATYKVTSSEKNAVEVAYVAPAKKTKNVTIPDTVTLKDNTVAKVTSIDAGAFKKNTKLETITVSKNVKTIGKDAFNGCKNLKKVKGAKNVTKIEKNAFANCKKLSSVTLGSKVTTIGEKAFYKCTGLKKITIPKNVKTIEKSAFEGCKNLKTVNIKTTKLTKKTVKKNAFKGTPSKAKFDVPNSKKKAYSSMLKTKGVSKKASIQ